MSPEHKELIAAARALLEENRKAYAAQRIADLREIVSPYADPALRAAIAGNVLASMCAGELTPSLYVSDAVRVTDALLAELERTRGQP